MQKLTLLIISLFFTLTALHAQEAFIVLKRKQKTIHTYTTGSALDLTLVSGSRLNALLVRAKPDSLVLRPYFIQRLESAKGFVFLDTLYAGNITLALGDIGTVHNAGRSKFAYKTSEYTAYLAAAWFSIVSVVNGVKFNDDIGTSLTQAAVRGGGLFLLGRVFHWIGRSDFRLGRKYRLAIVQL